MTTFFLRIQAWVDRQWEAVGQWRLLILPSLAAIFIALIVRDLAGIAWRLTAISMFGLAVAWQMFVWWRCWHYMKRSAKKSGQMYEKSGRYKLPPEYSDSEDAFMARERKKRRS